MHMAQCDQPAWTEPCGITVLGTGPGSVEWHMAFHFKTRQGGLT